MKANNMLKAKLCTIGLSLIFSVLLSCTTQPQRKPEFIRFEDAVKKAELSSLDSTIYVFWSQHSCGGCRSETKKLTKQYSVKKSIKIISPAIYTNELNGFDHNLVFIDDHNLFTKKYFGIDNVGIIKVAQNKVYFIRDYSPNEMKKFAQEMLNN